MLCDMTEPAKKIDILRGYMAREDWRAALKLAASFPSLGAEKRAITQGWEAMARPDFYRQIRKDPSALVAEGIAALRRRYAA